MWWREKFRFRRMENRRNVEIRMSDGSADWNLKLWDHQISLSLFRRRYLRMRFNARCSFIRLLSPGLR